MQVSPQPSGRGSDAPDNAAKIREWRRLLLPGVLAAGIWLVPVAAKPVLCALFLLSVPLAWVLPLTCDLPAGGVRYLPLTLAIVAGIVAIAGLPPLAALRPPVLPAADIIATVLSLTAVLWLYVLERRARALEPALLKLRHTVTSRLVICYLIVFAYLLNPYF